MTAEIIWRIETYKTGSGWEYQVRQYFDRSTNVPFVLHDSLGDKAGGYESEKEALRAAKPRLRKMSDSIIKDLIDNRPIVAQLICP
jgi:hypothetical protein